MPAGCTVSMRLDAGRGALGLTLRIPIPGAHAVAASVFPQPRRVEIPMARACHSHSVVL